MITISLSIGTSPKRDIQVPSSWDELTPHQFAYVVSHPPTSEIPYKAIRHLLQLTPEEELFLLPSDIYAIWDHFQWLNDPRQISTWVLSEITLPDGRSMLPPANDFDNVTWEEFVFADQLAQNDNWPAVAACLFRPAKPNPSEDEDERIPFTRFGASNRVPQFLQLPAPVIKAVEVNYLALRRHVTDRYNYLFHHSASSNGSGTGWVEVSHQVLGDNVWNEDQLLHTSVHQVLSHLNHIIHENKHRRHEKNK